MIYHHDIKFILDVDINEYFIENAFNKAEDILNRQFDENFNVIQTDGEVAYQIKDVSNLKETTIEEIIYSFFDFTFHEVIDVPLYRFLVLKNNENFIILANINSLIFDYTSINDFYELFGNAEKFYPKYNLNSYYNNIHDYLNSSDFENDSYYWKNYLLNSSKYIKFYNIKHNHYKSQKINPDIDSIFSFIKNHDCSLFDFYGSIFSLYLSRIDRLDGCLLKTIVPTKKTNLQIFDKNTIFKVDLNQHETFNVLLKKFSSSFRKAANHTNVDVENYLDEKTSYYSIYDFSEFNENIHIYTGEYSALTLNIHENCLELIYNTDLFSDVYIEHMVKNIENLISNVLNSPNQTMGDIDILSDEEKSLLSNFCKGKTIEVDEDKLFSHAFREYANANPDAIAVNDGINQITYGELEKSTNSIANDLHENYEMKPGGCVGIMLPRNYHFPELVVALNKINVAYVPIDLSFPINRIEHMLNVSQAEHLITTKNIAQNLDLNINIILIEDLRDNDDVSVEILSKKNDLFAIIFTSGTTGIPKGVMFYNRQFPWLCTSFAEIFNFSYGDCVGSYFSFSFVASFIIFITLYLGGCLRLFNENEQKNSLLLIKTLKETHINNLILPPGIGMPIFENEDLKLDYLILGGAKLNDLSKKDRHTKLVNFYGTTEILFAISKIYDLKNIKDNHVPIGKPIANTWTYILDDNNNMMPLGVPGEICISGGLISPGYYNDSKLTSQLFVDNPFNDGEINKTMYRTGDIGFYNFDGEIEIIGREDDQLSVRGFRIESDEILNIMKSFKEISDIYLDVDNDTLIAYYTTSDNLNISDVKEALKIQLPYYMIPSLFIELEKIPLNINGKIDKFSLKTNLNNENIEITDEVIKCVIDAFKEVLNLDSVLIDDDFVSLGGTSLSAMKLQLILKEKLNVHLSSNEIITLSTPKNIGEHIKFNLNLCSTFDEDKYSFDGLCHLSESQLNVYLDENVNDMGTAYNNPFKIDFKDNYSIKEIKDALIKLFDAFPILKARVLNDNGDLSFAFDGEPEITEKSSNDMKTFVKPFDLDKFLSRFSIIDSENTIILYADFHHMIFDGTSLNILLKKFFSILNGEDDVDFADNGILRQISFEESTDSEYMDNAQKFFNKMFTDRDEVYELLPSVECNTNDFELIDTFDIDMEYLNTFLMNHSITPNQFFTSVFAYALSRFTGSDKVLFNLIEDGRGHIDLSESVGMFVKTLPILMDCKNQDIDSYLNYSSNLINSVMKYDLYPFRVLANEYNLNSNILFQYSHNLFSNIINNEDLGYDICELNHDLNADLSFDILNNGRNSLTIRISYTQKYSKIFMEHFVESYKLILHEMVKVNQLKDINYISNDDIELLDNYNQTDHHGVYDDILDAFNNNLAKYPKNNLVTYNNNVYTYEEGAFIADKIARNLKNIGVNKDDNVAFLVERSELYIFNILGILSVGATYVPLDDTLPDKRIKFMIDDTDAKFIIVSNETYNRAKNLSKEIKLLNISNLIKEDAGTLSKLDVVYGDLACILYTSGTTGIPKGVRITRKTLINVAESYIETIGMDNNDVYGLFSSIGFDMSSFVISVIMCVGACLSVIPEEIRFNISKLNEYFIKQNVSQTFISTQMGKLFMQSVDDTSLDVLLVAGEKLGEFESPKNYRLIDAYGPTEAFFISLIDNNNKLDESSVGMLNSNMKAYILDNEFRRVPVGAVGELYLAGIQIADRYLNRPEETKKAFIDNPFNNNENCDLLYRTGDMVRLLPDGSLGIVGRRDNQVKIRGNRVELSEIESVIREIDYVYDVTVQTLKNGTNNEVVAYVVVNNEMSDDMLKDYITSYVGEYKPEYMIPSYVVKLEEIPLNINGKVDKRSLPDIDFDSLHTEYVAPTNEAEKAIIKAFEKAFNIEKIGIHDDFIRLGGDSLIAIKIVSQLEEYNITVADIFSLHTPHAIAKNAKKIEYNLDIYNLESGCPLNESQLNVYLDILVNNKDDAYLIPLHMEISKKYDVNKIINALNSILEVHPILGMCISEDYEVPYLIRGSKPSIIVESEVSEDFIAKFINEPFDLHDNLCRFLIVNDNDNYKLFAVFSHIIFDALSNNVFKHDLQSILDGKLLDIDESYLKVAAFSQQIQNTDDFSDAEKFYESMLADNGESEDLIASVDASEPGALRIDLDLNNDLLKLFLTKHGISENILFTSAFAYTLSLFTGAEYASFNMIENGRDRFNNFNSIGMYVNTLPLLVNCKNQNLTSFIEHMASLIHNVTRYNYYPFRWLANEYDVNSNTIFQFLPEWIELDLDEDIPSNTLEKDILTRRDNMIADFTVEVTHKGEDYILNIFYCDKYSNNFAQHFATSYKLILEQLISVEKLDEINYITKEDIEILDGYNQTHHPLKYDDILDAFNDNLADYPNNNLVLYNDSVFTYAEGAFIADKIAKLLKDYGVETGDNVSFLVERSELYMFSVLGILSVGAVYVPLDDAHPDNRIRFILEDTKSKVVIVSDDTYERAKALAKDAILLNVSDMLKEDIGTLDKLSVVYGNLACILYTSGTTGVPKGVKITRKAILNTATSYVNNYGMTSYDSYGLYASIGFDVGSLALFATIYAGASLNIIPEDIKLDMIKLNEYFTKHDVTYTAITAQVAKLFMKQNNDTNLKLLSVGGEKLGDVENPDYQLIDEYGPSEAFGFVSSINNLDKIDSSSVGWLNYNTKAYVLDGQKRRVPINAVGELYLAGYQIADGYLNREEETIKSFVKNPFEESDEYNIMYRTGDMVRLLPDNSLAMVGRRDSQVKIRGNRVELSEIETVIREIDFVRDVTIQTIKRGTNNELVAYVVVTDNLEGDNLSDSICEYVGERKPEYMIPSYVIRLDAIPVTVNGKIDKNALPEVDVEGFCVEYVAPTTETEKIIVEAFESVFDQDKIGLYDDFVRLGGDSISAIRVISFIQKKGISCSAKEILTYKTPYLIAQNIAEIEHVSYDSIDGEVDLLPIQSYFFDQINSNEFSQEFVLKANTDLDLDTLQKSFDELTNIHDMLRANYRYENGNAVQEILPIDTRICEINEVELTGDLKAAIRNLLNQSISSINMYENLISISLARHDDECYVVFVIHHLIIDGVSWSILINDLAHIYTQITENKEISLLRPYSYKSWVENVQELVKNISDAEKQHWIDTNSLLDESSIKGKSKIFNFSADVSFDVDNLLMLSEEEYLALCIARAYKKTYGEDIIFNRESFGRDETVADVSRTIGWFTTQYPVPVNVNNEYDKISLMEDVYSIKTAFNNVKHLGLNYGSLIYTSKEFEFKHCPVTFNFLSTEFSFKNELFESFNEYLAADENNDMNNDSTSYGVIFNVARMDDFYMVKGDYAEGTYLGDKFDEFVENIKKEFEFIGKYESDEIICCLSEPQLGIYLDEKVNDMGTAYATPGVYECGLDKSHDEIRNAIVCLIDKHPILKGRVVDRDIPLLVCDSYPTIDTADEVDYSKLIKPFDLNKSLARFSIIENEENKYIFYDIHHIINDATSGTFITEDLNSIFKGTFDDAVDLGFAYACRDSFESKFKNIYEEAHDFFNKSLSDIDEVSPMLHDLEGVDNVISLPIRGVRSLVEEYCRENGITVGNFLNAIFAYTYSRFTGSDKVYYNYTEHGRHENYNQKSLGMFVRTIPVIVDCKNVSIKDYLSNVSDLLLDSMKYSVYPFRLLANEFELNNNVSFEYNFNLNDISGFEDEIIIRDSVIDLISDILCVVNDLSDGYLVTVESSKFYSNETVIRFLNVFKEVLIQILDNEYLSDVSYICSDDLDLLDDINQNEYPLVYEDILDAFNGNLADYPDNILVSYSDSVFTYAEGAFVADKIAKSLKDFSIETGDNVAFLVERSEMYMFCVLGILSTGATYVPLDDAHPNNRVEFILEDTQSKVVIVSDDTYERVKSLVKDASLLNISDIIREGIGTLDKLPIVYGDLACILYTSGTTGVPKGVKVTRKAVLNVSSDYCDKYNLGFDDVYGLFSSIGFDAASFAINAVLYSGACLSIVPEDIRLNMLELNRYFIENNVTHSFITTQVGKLFAQSVNDVSLDVLLVGGEKLGEFKSPENYNFVDIYGPTEAFTYISLINNSEKIDYSSVGLLNYNMKCYIIDDEFRRVPMGAVGELCLAGYQIADGYLNREEENIKAFIDNPFDSDEDYGTLYRTGDMVRLLPDKTLAIVGRRDSQVKIRGNRLELSEVEAVIREIDFIEDLTVQIIKNGYKNELVAYVVVSKDLDVDLKTAVCDYVAERKPEYMIPSFVIRLDELPLNVNGKIDKRALPEVEMESFHEEYVAPRNENEKEIVKAFEKALNMENIGIYDDFIRLGGDSLTGVKLLSYIGSNDVTMADIFAFRTPAAIAKNMSDLSFDLDLYTLESGCPLNTAQINVFADLIVYNKKDAYHIPGFISIPKEYGLKNIRNALDKLLDVHPILSMHLIDEYEETDEADIGNADVLNDLIRTFKKFGIKKIMDIIKLFGLRDVSGLYKMIRTIMRIFKGEYPYMIKGDRPPISLESNFDKDIIVDFFTESLDIYANLSKFMIIESEESYYLLYLIHHIIFDATSAGVFKHDFKTILDGGSIELDDTFLKTSSYTHQIKKSGRFDEAAEFYESILSDIDDVGILAEDNLSKGYSISSYDLEFNKEAFKSFLKNVEISENILFTGVFAYTLSQFVSGDKVLFTMIENGRDRFNENFIGMTSNIMPVIVDCKDQSIDSYMKEVANLVYGVSRHSYYPLLLLYQKYNFEVQILFQFVPNWIVDDFMDVNMDSNEIVNSVINTLNDAIAEFFVQVYQNGDDYRLIITHSNNYSQKMINDFKDTYISILLNIINASMSSDLSNTLK